jgi:hypothetical protein
VQALQRFYDSLSARATAPVEADRDVQGRQRRAEEALRDRWERSGR